MRKNIFDGLDMKKKVEIDLEKYRNEIIDICCILDDPIKKTVLLLALGVNSEKKYTQKQISKMLELSEKKVGVIIDSTIDEIKEKKFNNNQFTFLKK